MGLKVKCPKDSGQGPKSIGNSSEVLLHIGSVQLCKTLHRALPSLNSEVWAPYAAIKTEMSTLSSKLTSHCAVQNPCRYPRSSRDTFRRRQGALPGAPRNGLKYSETWPSSALFRAFDMTQMSQDQQFCRPYQRRVVSSSHMFPLLL
jgi:hypothetical protein